MKIIFIMFLIIALSGCAGGGTAVRTGADPGNQEDAAARLKSLTGREAKGLKSLRAQGDLQISVPAKAEPQAKLIEEEPAQYQLDIPIGTSEDVTCYLSEDFSFPAVTIKTLFDSFSEMPNIEWFAVKTIEADILENVGYLYLEAEYLTKDKKYGTAKIITSSTVNGSFYCIHDEPGYKQTFLKIADSLVRSDYFQSLADEFSHYDKKQIDVVYLNNMAIGYMEGYQFTAEEATRKSFQFSTLLLPVSPNELMASDSIDITDYEGETGALLAGSYYEYENDEEDHGIEIEQVAPRRYQVQGTLQGQPFSEVFESGQPLLFSGFILDAYAEGSTSGERVFQEYIPFSPARPTESKIAQKEILPNGNKRVEYSFHTAKAVLELDERSHMQMNLELGGLSLLSKRKFFDAR